MENAQYVGLGVLIGAFGMGGYLWLWSWWDQRKRQPSQEDGGRPIALYRECPNHDSDDSKFLDYDCCGLPMHVAKVIPGTVNFDFDYQRTRREHKTRR